MFNNKFKFSDDEDVFDIASASNLANIFGEVMHTQQEEANSSLKYIPKKPKKPVQDVIPQPQQKNQPSTSGTGQSSNTDATTAKPSEWIILVAKVVTGFQLVNNENKSHGKIALAVLKNTENNLKIILYRTKEQILSTINLSKIKKVFVNSIYLQYHDDFNIFWSISFDNNDMNEVITLIKDSCLLQNNDENVEIKEDKITNTTENETTDVSVEKDLNNEIDEKIDDPQTMKTKENILTRMAKMGQAVPFVKPQPPANKPKDLKLIKQKSITSDISDSSEDDIINTADKKFVKQQRIVKTKQKPILHQQLVPIMHSNNQSQQYYQTYQQQQQPQIIDPTLNIYFSEQRQQNTELRINISKLDTKLDKIIDKIDVINIKDSSIKKTKDQLSEEDTILKLEEKLVELKKENLRLRLLNNELDGIMAATAENAAATISNAITTNSEAEIKSLINEKMNNELKIKDLTKLIQEEKNEKEKLSKTIIGLTDDNDRLLQESRNKDDLIKKHENSISELLEKIELNKTKINEINKTYNEDVKNLMNEIYQSVYKKLTEKDKHLDASIQEEQKELLTFLGHIFKEKTYLALRTIE